MLDFKIDVYIKLIKAFKDHEYRFQTFEQFIDMPQNKVIVLRHDVDRMPENAAKMAEIEHGFNVFSTFYFRSVPESFNPEIIARIYKLGHEIGYHYEDLTLAKGDPEKAVSYFKYQLDRFRKICPVKTICMHGSPFSKYDNRLLWDYYNYRDFGIVGEPYFDTDFSKICYITDTGRCWNGDKVNIRDKVDIVPDGIMPNKRFCVPCFRSTFDIIEYIEARKFPEKAMINVHPQRWNDRFIPWTQELLLQNIKNVVKYFMVRLRNQSE